MDPEQPLMQFSDRYARLRSNCAHEEPERVTEHLVQCAWYDQNFASDQELTTLEGHRINVISPGWWNAQEGPDFRGAQIEFNGVLHAGDVEIHLEHNGWKAHGHHIDTRYDKTVLHVLLQPPREGTEPVVTSEGRAVPTLVLAPLLPEDFAELAGDTTPDGERAWGKCSALIPDQGPEPVKKFLQLAGEWRMLNKARALRRRMETVGPDQAIYEAIFYACGFSRFKQHFQAIARHLPYERARQLAQEDPMLLEAALLHLAGLLPANLPNDDDTVPHFARIRALRHDHLEGLRSLPLDWSRLGVRPVNYPERRLAGAARLVGRTAQHGLAETLERIWREDGKPLARRRSFEALFPRAVGFWAGRCTWTGKSLARPAAPIGPGRVRSIIGNVIIPASLAQARQARDRSREECIFEFFGTLPKEPDNHVVDRMVPRVLRDSKTIRINFQIQQGLLQMHQDWCEPNPSCRNCSMFDYLDLNDLEQN